MRYKYLLLLLALLALNTPISAEYFRHCRFRRVNAALRPTCVAGSSGVARNDPDRSTLQPWALSLDGGVCISDPIIAICHNSRFAAKAHIRPLRTLKL